eukprot:jgi/Chrpa1/19796/Chrysochromulina_OHIO_Genome00026223-RA
MDRVNNEWIMDAVTHQPLGKQVAIKDDDGVFYWDLNVKQAVTPGGVLPQQTQYVGNMRQSYDEWYQGMVDQWLTLKDNNPTMQSMLQARTNHLVKTTRPKNLRNWLRLTNSILIHQIRQVQLAKDRELERGEVRLEIMGTRLNEKGLQILAGIGTEYAAGDALVLVESMIPGGNPPEHLSEPYPLKKGYSKFKGRDHAHIVRRYRTEGNESETAELMQILEDVDPSSSDVTIQLIVANKQGRKWYITDGKGKAQLKGFIGITKISLKELLRDGKPQNNGTCEMEMAFDLMGFVHPEVSTQPRPPPPLQPLQPAALSIAMDTRPPVPVRVPFDLADGEMDADAGSEKAGSETAGSEKADAPVAARKDEPRKEWEMYSGGMGGQAMKLLSDALSFGERKDTLCYTFAYWIKWRPIESLSDQLLFFGETRNMPALVRNNQLGALVDNVFCATDFDPRLAGDNRCLLVVTNDGRESQFWIGYHSTDTKGAPQPARALLPEPKRPATYVSTEMDASVQIRRLVTSSKGAGLLAQAWIWPRDLTKDEILELWIETKSRYPLWKPGFSQYRPAPQPMSALKKPPSARPSSSKKPSSSGSEGFGIENDGEPPPPRAATLTTMLPWDRYDPLIEKDNAAMLDPSLASKLAFQRLKNVFSVLIDYATFSQVFLVIDKNQNSSPTAELMIEIALRGNTGLNPKVVVMDSRPRLERAAAMLQALIECKFLIDQELAYKKKDAPEEQKVTEYKLTSIDYATPRADLRRLVTPAGLAWL